MNDNWVAGVVTAVVQVAAQISDEFPEIVKDSTRVARGEKPTSQIFERTSAVFSKMIGVSSSARFSAELLLLSARSARDQIRTELKPLRLDKATQQPDDLSTSCPALNQECEGMVH